MEIQGIEMSGIELIGSRGFNSIEGLKMDFDSDIQWNSVTKEWANLVDGKLLRLTDFATQSPYVTHTSDGISFDGITGSIAINMTIKTPDPQWVKAIYNDIHVGSPHGIYIIGKIEGTPTTVIVMGGRSAVPANVDAFRFLNNAGVFRGNALLGSVSTNFGNVTANVFKCWQQVLRENNQANNLTFRENNTLITQTIKNNVASALDVVSILNNVPAGVRLTIKKYLLYKWTGKTTAQVNILDQQVKDLITSKYGIIL